MSLPSSAATRASIDRKSTRLNSSLMSISYAVFCLKKKNLSGPIKFHRSSACTRMDRRGPCQGLGCTRALCSTCADESSGPEQVASRFCTHLVLEDVRLSYGCRLPTSTQIRSSYVTASLVCWWHYLGYFGTRRWV